MELRKPISFHSTLLSLSAWICFPNLAIKRLQRLRFETDPGASSLWRGSNGILYGDEERAPLWGSSAWLVFLVSERDYWMARDWISLKMYYIFYDCPIKNSCGKYGFLFGERQSHNIYATVFVFMRPSICINAPRRGSLNNSCWQRKREIEFLKQHQKRVQFILAAAAWWWFDWLLGLADWRQREL